MGKINDNDFIPILKAFNLQGFERHIKCLKNWNESCFFKQFGGIYKKGNKVVVESTIKYFVKSW